ncbi:MAG: adenosylcobinamide amidohydrolase, partial [Haloferacaceae archaeon]
MTDRRRPGQRAGIFDATVREGVLRLRRPGTRWLSTGHAGGASEGPVAYNVTVPEGWDETDLTGYVARRRERAGFATAGPTLLTGVDQGHARRARLDGVEAVVTAGVSNPAALAMPDGPASATDGAPSTDSTPADAPSRDATPSDTPSRDAPSRDATERHADATADASQRHDGTINVFVGTDRAL